MRSKDELRDYMREYNLTYVRPVESEQRRREAARLYEQNNREKKLAHQAVKRALKQGLLIKPLHCEECDMTNIRAHHDDYSKKLDVVWLCESCHKRRHNKIKGVGKRLDSPLPHPYVEA